jgi:hypothetical protein
MLSRAVRRKFGGIDHLPVSRDMRVTDAVAALTGNTGFPEWRYTVSIRGPHHRLHAAGMAFETDRIDSTRKKEGIVVLVAG